MVEKIPRFGAIREVCKIAGRGRSTIKALERQGLFPKGIRFNSRSTLYRLDAVEIWVEEKTKELSQAG